jgi:hypothetical protein
LLVNRLLHTSTANGGSALKRPFDATKLSRRLDKILKLVGELEKDLCDFKLAR